MKNRVKDMPVDHKIRKTSSQLWYMLARTYQFRARDYGRFLKRWQLTIGQFELLRSVAGHSRISQKDLAAELLMTKGNITQLVVKMEKLGYIFREQQWKTKYLMLTEKGTTLYRTLEKERQHYFADAFGRLTKKQQKQLIKLLKRAAKADE
ncbi:MAG: MarR family transcriptional regulator [Sporolactobacillus sp.]|nr:MarR family transcriptional regulator [Sporolactobacillus sp.]